MAAEIRVILFEDTAAVQSTILDALKNHLGGDGNVTLFEAKLFDESPTVKEKTYEDRIESILQKAPFAGTTLLVVDRDLSKSVSFRGLSVNAVATAASRLAIPICSYAREPESD